MDDSQWHILCWQQAPPRKPQCMMWSGLCLSKIWAWSCSESGGTRLIPGPHQSERWHQNWSVTAFLFRVHYICEKFHGLFYFQFFLSTLHHGLHVLLCCWCFLGIFWFGAVGLFFLLFFLKENRLGWSVGWVCFPEGSPCCTGRKIISHSSCPWLPSLKVRRDGMVQKVLWKLCCLTLPLVCDPSK